MTDNRRRTIFKVRKEIKEIAEGLDIIINKIGFKGFTENPEEFTAKCENVRISIYVGIDNLPQFITAVKSIEGVEIPDIILEV